MVQAVQLFRTSDGTVFESETEARAHESLLVNKERIEAFINRHFPIPEAEVTFDENGNEVKKVKSNQSRGPARKALSLWLAENP